MLNTATSEVLIQRAAQGDRVALTELLERHGPTIRERFRSQIPKRLQSVLSLDDLMQETYTDAFLDIGEFASQGDGSFERWLSTIAKNNLSNAQRQLEAEKRGGKRQRVELGVRDHSVDALCELLGYVGSTPSGAAAKIEAREAVLRAIDQLPMDYRQVVRMYDLEERDVNAVASALGRRPGAVFMLRARAHRALRKVLGNSSGFLSGSA